MSKKDSFIEQARQARVNHNKWINQIRLIVSGLEKDKNTIALNQSESPFGVWLYTKATIYSISNSKMVLDEIETLYNECYEEYHKIYAVLFKDDGGGLIKSLFGAKKASNAEYQLAEQHYEALLGKSDQLLNKLKVYENQLNATSSEKFDKALEDHDEPDMKSMSNAEIEAMLNEQAKSKEQRYYRGSLITDD